MNLNSENLVDLIFKKLKNYKSKEIFLEKKVLKKFIFSLLKENWTQRRNYKNCYYVLIINDFDMHNFSSLTISLIIIFIMSLFFLYTITSNSKN